MLLKSESLWRKLLDSRVSLNSELLAKFDKVIEEKSYGLELEKTELTLPWKGEGSMLGCVHLPSLLWSELMAWLTKFIFQHIFIPLYESLTKEERENLAKFGIKALKTHFCSLLQRDLPQNNRSY